MFRFYVLCALFALLVTTRPAFGDGIGVQGYVFDKTTLRPLKNVTVRIEYSSGDTSTVTNDDGFFVSGANQQPGEATFFRLICNTRRGVVARHFPAGLPTAPSEAAVIERNFYLPMPRNTSTCLPSQ